jgi:hypothetical protein
MKTALSRRSGSRILSVAARFLLGVALGVMFHYLLYRISLPVEPFIYVAF